MTDFLKGERPDCSPFDFRIAPGAAIIWLRRQSEYSPDLKESLVELIASDNPVVSAAAGSIVRRSNDPSLFLSLRSRLRVGGPSILERVHILIGSTMIGPILLSSIPEYIFDPYILIFQLVYPMWFFAEYTVSKQHRDSSERVVQIAASLRKFISVRESGVGTVALLHCIGICIDVLFVKKQARRESFGLIKDSIRASVRRFFRGVSQAPDVQEHIETGLSSFPQSAPRSDSERGTRCYVDSSGKTVQDIAGSSVEKVPLPGLISSPSGRKCLERLSLGSNFIAEDSVYRLSSLGDAEANETLLEIVEATTCRVSTNQSIIRCILLPIRLIPYTPLAFTSEFSPLISGAVFASLLMTSVNAVFRALADSKHVLSFLEGLERAAREADTQCSADTLQRAARLARKATPVAGPARTRLASMSTHLEELARRRQSLPLPANSIPKFGETLPRAGVGPDRSADSPRIPGRSDGARRETDQLAEAEAEPGGEHATLPEERAP